MGTARMWGRYSNPADLFAASVRIEEALRRMDMQMACDPISEGSSDIWFEVYRSNGDVGSLSTDALHMDEWTFDLLRPAVVHVLGDGFDGYSFVNMVNPVHRSQLVAELKRMAWLILHDPASPELAEWRDSFPSGLLEPFDPALDQNEPAHVLELIRTHRNRLSLFFSFLIAWLEEVDSRDECLNIRGL